MLLEHYPISQDRDSDLPIGWNCSSIVILEHLYRIGESLWRLGPIR